MIFFPLITFATGSVINKLQQKQSFLATDGVLKEAKKSEQNCTTFSRTTCEQQSRCVWKNNMCRDLKSALRNVISDEELHRDARKTLPKRRVQFAVEDQFKRIPARPVPETWKTYEKILATKDHFNWVKSRENAKLIQLCNDEEFEEFGGLSEVEHWRIKIEIKSFLFAANDIYDIPLVKLRGEQIHAYRGLLNHWGIPLTCAFVFVPKSVEGQSHETSPTYISEYHIAEEEDSARKFVDSWAKQLDREQPDSEQHDGEGKVTENLRWARELVEAISPDKPTEHLAHDKEEPEDQKPPSGNEKKKGKLPTPKRLLSIIQQRFTKA